MSEGSPNIWKLHYGPVFVLSFVRARIQAHTRARVRRPRARAHCFRRPVLRTVVIFPKTCETSRRCKTEEKGRKTRRVSGISSRTFRTERRSTFRDISRRDSSFLVLHACLITGSYCYRLAASMKLGRNASHEVGEDRRGSERERERGTAKRKKELAEDGKARDGGRSTARE